MKTLHLFVACAATIVLVASCSPRIVTDTSGTKDIVGKQLESNNRYDLIISDTPIEHVIDISTEAGRIKLRGISKADAQALVYTEALFLSKSATIVDPKYTFTIRKGRILGVKIYGFPAKYKNH